MYALDSGPRSPCIRPHRVSGLCGGDEEMHLHLARTSRSVWGEAPRNEGDGDPLRTVFLRMAWLDSARIRRSKLEGMNEGDREGADQYAERAELS